MKKIHSVVLMLILTSCNSVRSDSLVVKKDSPNSAAKPECDVLSILKQSINTDTIYFDIGTKLSWSFNCDSAWLTYINQENRQVILDSWTENPELSAKMGLYYLMDFKTKIVLSKNIISGCCDLPDNIIIDKKTGKVLANIGPRVWYSENREFPLIIYFGNLINNRDQVSSSFSNLVIHNLDSNKEFYFDLSAYKFFKDLDEGYLTYHRDLVESYKVENSVLLITFSKQHKLEKRRAIKQVVKINLKDYIS